MAFGDLLKLAFMIFSGKKQHLFVGHVVCFKDATLKPPGSNPFKILSVQALFATNFQLASTGDLQNSAGSQVSKYIPA